MHRKNYFSRSWRAQHGVTLIELMVALVLGLLVLGAVIQLFIGSKATYMSNEALARVQENGRFSMEVIKREFRGAASRGVCASRLVFQNHFNTGCGSQPEALFSADTTIMGFDFAGTERGDDYTLPEELDPDGQSTGQWTAKLSDGSTETLPSWLQNEVVPGSDVVVVRSAEVVPGVTSATTSGATDSTLDLTGAHGLEAGDFALVTNCRLNINSSGSGFTGDIFQNTGTGSQLNRTGGSCGATGPGNAGGIGSWATQYGDGMQVYRIEMDAYFVGYNDETGEPGLYRHNISEGRTEELVSGVENMQVLYGYSNPADEGGDGQTVNHWLPASEVASWDLVIGARLALLVRSPENLGDGTTTQGYDLASVTITNQEDGRLRQPFLASISLRNQQLVM
jgi:type IV pilus assembly protein PilW